MKTSKMKNRPKQINREESLKKTDIAEGAKEDVIIVIIIVIIIAMQRTIKKSVKWLMKLHRKSR